MTMLPQAPDGWCYWGENGEWRAMPVDKVPSEAVQSGGRWYELQLGATYDLRALVQARLLWRGYMQVSHAWRRYARTHTGRAVHTDQG